MSKREAILDAALHAFAERGFHGTAVPRLAERASVGAGTIYRYFAHKEELVNAVYQRCKTDLMTQLLEAFPFDAGARHQFRVFWRRLASFARARPEAIGFLELHHHAPYLNPTSRALELESLQPVVAFFLQASEAGVLKARPPEVLISVVWGAFVGLLKAERLGHLELSDAVVEAAEECCWDAIRNHEGG